MSKMTKTSYPTPEAAALGGFRRILLSHSRWTDVEFGFLILEVERGRERRSATTTPSRRRTTPRTRSR